MAGGREFGFRGECAVGASRGDFVKYPRTPHLFGSRGTADDKHLGPAETAAMLADPSLVVEEKLDGTNVGLHFTPEGRFVIQCRGHEVTTGMHPQYDLLKRWAAAKRPTLEAVLGDRLILFGEWLYAKHSVSYAALPHYFFEFDLYDKSIKAFLDLDARLTRLDGTGICTVPVLHRGATDEAGLRALVGPSAFASSFDNPLTGRADDIMEGLYVRTEAGGRVTARAKLEFVERVKLSEHWQHAAMVPNRLAPDAEMWS